MKENHHIHFCKKYQSLLKKNYPSAAKLPGQTFPISSIIIPLPKVAVQQISALVKLLYRTSRLKLYRDLIQTEEKDFQQFQLNSDSLLMAYDFHWSQDQLRLIEVNTNAAGYLFSNLVDQVHGKKTSALLSLRDSFQAEWNKWQQQITAGSLIDANDSQVSQLKHSVQKLRHAFYRKADLQSLCAKAELVLSRMFKLRNIYNNQQSSDKHAGNRGAPKGGYFAATISTLLSLFCKSRDKRAGNRGEMSPATRGLDCFLIVDQEVKEQKMYREFLMYKDWLASFGWPCQICEIGDLTLNKHGQLIDPHFAKVDMVYNRCTDFYLKNYPNIKKSFLNQTSYISPNPVDYLLLADKNRLCEWSSETFLNQLDLNQTDKKLTQQIVPFTNLVCKENVDYLWQNRKKFIFKPLKGYGGKAVYRGKNVTGSKFKEIIKDANYVYQEYVPPGRWTDSEGKIWKYDIRAYVYQDQVQHLVARVYQGQVTNFKIEGSGFASVFTQ